MIDFNSESVKRNAEILLTGIWYSELPDLLEINDGLVHNIEKVLMQQDNMKYDSYVVDNDGFITDFKNINSPMYLRFPGVEPIIYYTFKKNGTLREMQIPNLIHHVGFIYDSLWIFQELFEKLYLDTSYEEKICNSSSYIVLGEEFYIHSEYDDFIEIEEGIFISSNNKMYGNALVESKKMQFDEQAGVYLYSMKLDIESFFPNIYTHYLEKIGDKSLYKNFTGVQKYFKFLDVFHQRINNNQTKGIPAGVFSSHIAAELLMLSVDDEIRKMIEKEDIGYIRYVDDLTFFSDSKEKLENVNMKVQQILNQYRLRINGNKTDITRSIYNVSWNDMEEIRLRLSFLNDPVEVIKLCPEDIKKLKIYVGELLVKDRIPQLKTVFSLIYKKLEAHTLKTGETKKSLFCLLLLSVFENPNITWQVYRIIKWILDNTEDKSIYQDLLIKKLSIINSIYADSILQIWHYYVLGGSMNEQEKRNFFQNYKEAIKNPILVTIFVQEGKQKNKHIMSYIKQIFREESDTTDWKKRIMYSRWWLPLIKIKMVDGHNYESLFSGSVFPNVLQDIVT